jgi:hypothetical protein
MFIALVFSMESVQYLNDCTNLADLQQVVTTASAAGHHYYIGVTKAEPYSTGHDSVKAREGSGHGADVKAARDQLKLFEVHHTEAIRATDVCEVEKTLIDKEDHLCLNA